MNNPEYIGASFDNMMKSGAAHDMYVMIYRRVTSNQRDIIRLR